MIRFARVVPPSMRLWTKISAPTLRSPRSPALRPTWTFVASLVDTVSVPPPDSEMTRVPPPIDWTVP
jgi:hypothetical protein